MLSQVFIIMVLILRRNVENGSPSSLTNAQIYLEAVAISLMTAETSVITMIAVNTSAPA